MKNIKDWTAKRFVRDSKGRIIGTHNHKLIGNSYEPVIREFARGRLADLGCGDVPFYHFYKDNVTENICVDWGEEDTGISFLDYEADLNKKIDFLESGSFDSVLCTDVLEHICEPDVLFSEMARILKTNGHLVLAVPFMYWVHHNPHDYHRYTHFKLREFCKKYNLEVVKLETFGGLPEIIYDLVYKGYNYYNFPAKRLFYWFWRNFGTFLSKRKFVQRLSDSSKPTFPLGYILVAKKVD